MFRSGMLELKGIYTFKSLVYVGKVICTYVFMCLFMLKTPKMLYQIIFLPAACAYAHFPRGEHCKVK